MALNQKSLLLTKAIAMQEGGGKYLPYTAKSGDVPNAKVAGGRYQFMPKTWSNYAGQVLKNPNAPMTPENQNKVAYTKIDGWLQKGYTPAQAASMWNAGEGAPNSWKPGTKQKVGNTPQYVKNVQKYGQQLEQQVSRGAGYVPVPKLPYTEKQAAISQPQPQQPVQPSKNNILDTLGNIGKSAYGALTTFEKPFIGTAAIPTQLLAKALGKPDPFAGGIKNVVGAGQVTPLNLEKKAGDIAQVASYFVPGSGILGAAGMGALQGAGQSMTQGGDVGKVALGGALGGTLGAAASGVSGLLGYGLKKLGNGLTGAETRSALKGLKGTYEKILNLGVSEKRMENRTGKDLAQVLLEHQAPLEKNVNGTLNADIAINKLHESLAPLNQKATEILQNPQGVVKDIKLSDILSNVVKRINKSNITAEDKIKAIDTANSAIQAELAANGNQISPMISDSIKSAFWNKTFSSKLPSSAEKLRENVSFVIGNELKKAEENAVSGTYTGATLKNINAQRGDLIDAIRRLSDLNSVKNIRGGKLGNLFGGLAGTIIGTNAAGSFGGIAGDYLGSRASEFLNNPATMLAIQRAKLGASKKAVGLLGSMANPIGNISSKVGSGLISGSRIPALAATYNSKNK